MCQASGYLTCTKHLYTLWKWGQNISIAIRLTAVQVITPPPPLLLSQRWFPQPVQPIRTQETLYATSHYLNILLLNVKRSNAETILIIFHFQIIHISQSNVFVCDYLYKYTSVRLNEMIYSWLYLSKSCLWILKRCLLVRRDRRNYTSENYKTKHKLA